MNMHETLTSIWKKVTKRMPLIFTATIGCAALVSIVYFAINAVFSKFKTRNITYKFNEQLARVRGTGGDVLELATSQCEESFSRLDEKWILWDLVYIGTTVSEIRVPAIFRYHLRLSDHWRLATRGNVCIVRCPSIQPSLPTAMDTTQMQKRTESGWARFNKDENLAELERSITATMNLRAADDDHIGMVREECRKSVARFVKTWLIKEDQWRTNGIAAIIVVFPDEATSESDKDLERLKGEPAIKLE